MPAQRLRCPGCKGRGRIRKGNPLYQVECIECGMAGPVGDTEPQAWHRWNQLSRIPVRYLNNKEASLYLRIGESTLQKLQYRIKHSRIGVHGKGKTIFDIKDLDKFFRENRA